MEGGRPARATRATTSAGPLATAHSSYCRPRHKPRTPSSSSPSRLGIPMRHRSRCRCCSTVRWSTRPRSPPGGVSTAWRYQPRLSTTGSTPSSYDSPPRRVPHPWDCHATHESWQSDSTGSSSDAKVDAAGGIVEPCLADALSCSAPWPRRFRARRHRNRPLLAECCCPSTRTPRGGLAIVAPWRAGREPASDTSS